MHYRHGHRPAGKQAITALAHGDDEPVTQLLIRLSRAQLLTILSRALDRLPAHDFRLLCRQLWRSTPSTPGMSPVLLEPVNTMVKPTKKQAMFMIATDFSDSQLRRLLLQLEVGVGNEYKWILETCGQAPKLSSSR